MKLKGFGSRSYFTLVTIQAYASEKRIVDSCIVSTFYHERQHCTQKIAQAPPKD